jgi:hypothetical protein
MFIPFPQGFLFNVYNLLGYLYNREGQPPLCSAISIEYYNNNNNNKRQLKS